jgi:hypothetical protein
MAITETVIKQVPTYHKDPETGEEDRSKTPRLVDEVKVEATGKDVEALRPVFERAEWQKRNQLAAKKRKYGVTRITDPQGNVGEIFGHEEEKYRNLGWGRAATRPTFSVPFGEVKTAGRFRRTKYKFIDGELVEVFREEK